MARRFDTLMRIRYRMGTARGRGRTQNPQVWAETVFELPRAWASVEFLQGAFGGDDDALDYRRSAIITVRQSAELLRVFEGLELWYRGQDRQGVWSPWQVLASGAGDRGALVAMELFGGGWRWLVESAAPAPELGRQGAMTLAARDGSLPAPESGWTIPADGSPGTATNSTWLGYPPGGEYEFARENPDA